jgi:cytokinin dehydrogenase
VVGISLTTHRAGAQTDNVVELEVVTGTGRILRASPDEHPDLFDAVRAGLGQVGIITRAVLRLEPAPEAVRTYALRYPDLAGLVADQRRVLRERRADFLQGRILPATADTRSAAGASGWSYELQAAVYTVGRSPDDGRVLAGLSDLRAEAEIQDHSYREFVTAFDGFVDLLRANGAWDTPHPWVLGFLPGSAAERIAGDVLDGLRPDDLGPFGQVVFYPFDTAALTTPLLRMPAEPVVFPLNLVRIPSGDAELARDLVARNAAVYERVRKGGGVLYPVSAFPMTGAEWRRHFGDAWPPFRDAADRFDPRRTLNPGQGMFV